MYFEQKVNILIVDDQPENLLALEAILGNLEQNLVRATSGKDALRCLLNQDFAVILLDVQMPEMDGFETATLVRQRQRSRYTPIIFLTAFSTSDTFVFKGYSLGAVDYLFKPIEAEILTSKVKVFVDLFKKTAEVKRQAAELAAVNAELRQSEERFRSLSACSPVGIFLTDVEGRYTYTNPCYKAICGFTSLETPPVETPPETSQATPSRGESWLQLVHPDDREQVLADWSAQTLKGQEYSDEFRIIVHPDNLAVPEDVRWVHLRSSPMRSDQGELIGYVGTLADITERKHAEEARVQFVREHEAREQAEAANRMKDEFLATLSHELRTPLNSILGWTTMLRTRSFDQVAAARALETIERNAKLQAQLIEDILDVSRIIQGKLHLSFHLVNLVTVIQTAVETLRPAVEAKAIQLVVALDPSPGTPYPSPFLVSGDPVRLQQIVWNLLSNAIKFTPKGGKVELHLSIVDSHVQIRVSDTGIGIDKKFLPFIFDRFRQADSTTTRSYGGLGLGLAIVRHLVALHNGTVDVESDGEGQGATFVVNLRLSTAKEERERGQAATSSDISNYAH